MSFVFKNKDKLLIAGIILLACNLRSPITGVGSLISYIMNDLHLSGSISGLITTVPLIAFAVISPFAGKLAIRFGTGKTLTVSLLILAAGIALRSAGGTCAFFAVLPSSESALPLAMCCCPASSSPSSPLKLAY